MRTHFYNLLDTPVVHFQSGPPNRHELLGDQVVIIAPSIEFLSHFTEGIWERVVGIIVTVGDSLTYTNITQTLSNLTIPRDLLPYTYEIVTPYVQILTELYNSNNHNKELHLELQGYKEKLQVTRANYDKTLDRQTKMVDDIRIQKNRLNNIINSTLVGTWEWNIQNNEIIINERWANIAGYTLQELTPLTPDLWENIIHIDDRDLCAEKLQNHIQGTSDFFAVELRVRHKSGRWVWVQDQGKVLGHGSDGKPLWLYGTRQDVTARRSTEETIARMNDTLKSKNKELEQILYVASHDLRAPLVNIEGFSRELAEGIEYFKTLSLNELAPQATNYLEDMVTALDFIEKSAKKMDTLLSGLLKLSRLGREAMHIEPLNMNTLLDSVFAETEFSLRECNANIHHTSLPNCMGDAVAVNQIFTNIISNAIKYRSPERTLEVSITGEKSEDSAIYCIADNGIGIAPEHHQRIFEVFHRLNPSKNTGEGLGLSIVRQNLDRLGGSIRVESELHQGSRFWVSLPLAN